MKLEKWRFTQGINAPFSLTISGLLDAEIAAATGSTEGPGAAVGGFTPLFDGSCVNNPANYVCITLSESTSFCRCAALALCCFLCPSVSSPVVAFRCL